MSDQPTNGTRYRLDELERRLAEQAEEIRVLRARSHDLANELQKHGDHDRRLTDLEAQNVDVLSTKFGYLEKRVDAMAKALWTAAGSLLIAAAVFALSVASGQIG